MSLGVRKWIIIAMLASIFLLANILVVANWLVDTGVCNWARFVRTEFLTGTAITIIISLLILLVNPKRQTNNSGARLIRRCPVCDKALFSSGIYCSDCGSKI
jgi:membrane-bound acyltransferase YfiQ involved in biofilm formation